MSTFITLDIARALDTGTYRARALPPNPEPDWATDPPRLSVWAAERIAAKIEVRIDVDAVLLKINTAWEDADLDRINKLFTNIGGEYRGQGLWALELSPDTTFLWWDGEWYLEQPVTAY